MCFDDDDVLTLKFKILFDGDFILPVTYFNTQMGTDSCKTL